MKHIRFALIAALMLLSQTMLAIGQEGAESAGYVPAKRLVVTADTDLAGRDLQSIFDTSYEMCAVSCLKDDGCTAMTFNSRASSCFLKTDITGKVPYAGAVSGWVYATDPGVLANAPARATDLGFLNRGDLDAARQQAQSIAAEHPTGSQDAQAILNQAAKLGRDGYPKAAANKVAEALVLTDSDADWGTYADLLLAVPPDQTSDLSADRNAALLAAVNSYLRTGGPAAQATALFGLARALEANDRGQAMIPALTLAQKLEPRDAAAALLEDAIGKYGFNIAQTNVESDSANPRICAEFNGPLVVAGVDYATFVGLPDSSLAVEASDRQICISGVQHGKRYGLTFRKGLPAADGQTLAKDVALELYVRDRSPMVAFPGRAYILPRATATAIPVETVNAARLDLRLMRVSDRNLVRTIQQDYFTRPLDYWALRDFNESYASEVWSGSADLAEAQTNQSVVTSLPLQDVMKDLGPGIYVLQAEVNEADPERVAPAQQWFVISDLGVTTLWGADGVHVITRALGDAAAVPGAVVTLISRTNAVLATAESDAEGVVHFAGPVTAGRGGAAPSMVTVSHGDDFTFLSLTEAEFDLSDRGVTGRPAAPAVDVFLATDRGVYRAGETLSATVLARDASMQAITGLPLTVRLIRPDGVEYSRTLAPDAGGGGRAVSLPIDGGAPRGSWRIEVFAEDAAIPLASAPFLVEDFLPERIDFTLDMPQGPLPVGWSGAITVDARYLFGAPGADLAIEGDFRISPLAALEAYPGFTFGRYDLWPDSVGDGLYGLGHTDTKGRADIPVPAAEFAAPPTMPMMAHYTLRLAEGSGRPVERSIDRVVLPAKPVVGIKPAFGPEGVASGTDARFDVIAVGQDGKETAAAVSWRLNRIHTDYQWYSVSGQWNWELTTRREKVAEGQAAVAAGQPAGISARVDWGEYELVVATGGAGASASSVRFYAGGYVSAGAEQTPDMLELSLDKADYRPGETAKVRLVPRAPGVALIMVMSNRLVDFKAVQLGEGATEVELPVTDDWGAGVYVTASALRAGAADGASHAPARAIGLSYAKVDPGARLLRTTIEAPEAADPRGPLPVAVKVEGMPEGSSAWVTIAAVDEGILNVTATEPPDPVGHYLGQQKLGVAIRDVYGRLIDSANGAPGRVRSGGDGGLTGLKGPPPTEELVAYFSGPLEVGADGYARTGFDLPSFNGTVRLMAVAWSDKGVGEASKDVLVRDPVVVTASVPRFLAPGDESLLRLEFVHATGPAGEMGLTVTANGLDLGAVPQTITLADKGKARQAVSLKAPAGHTGLASIEVALVTPDGKTLVKTLAVPVERNDPAISRQNQFSLAPGSSFTIDGNVFDGLEPGTARATLALGAVARFNAPAILATLDRYPYGCTEQLTSKALPLLYFDRMAEAITEPAAPGTAAQADVHERVQKAIGEILLNQDANGAFGLWYPESGDLWLDAYVTDFLSRARAEGYQVPDTAFRAALDNLHNQVNYAPDFDSGGGPVAAALMVLAREGAAAIGDLRYYADAKADAFDTPIASAQLGAALAAYGDQQRADRMFGQAGRQAAAAAAGEEPQYWRADYGTALRDDAAVLALATEARSSAVSTEALAGQISGRIADRPLSTQEAAWTLMATRALEGGATEGRFTLDGAPLADPWLRIDDSAPMAEGGRVITNVGDGASTLTLTTAGVPTKPEPAGGKGYRIARSWFTLEGAPVDPSSVPQGARLVTVIEVQPLGNSGGRLLVSDPLPAGFEIDNPNLIRSGDIAALDWLTTTDTARRTEFRQDRFMAAIDWTSEEAFRLAYIVRAISPGRYHLPAASVEDMYRPDYRAWTDAGTVTIGE